VTLPTKFNYYRPKILDEALKLMDDLSIRGKVIAGGTDLIAGVRARKITLPENIIDINHIKQLNFIDDGGDVINIGATTKLSEISSSQIVGRKAPILTETISHMASPQIRNMGTIGGNLCNASPAADTAPPLLVLDAKVEKRSIHGGKVIPISEFFSEPGKTVVGPNELLTKIQIPAQSPSDRWRFVKLGRRKAFTLSIISITMLLKIEDANFKDVKIALGAVAPIPLRITRAEAFLRGKSVSDDIIDEAARIAKEEVKPISDVRASEEYRREMAYVLTKNALINLSKGI